MTPVEILKAARKLLEPEGAWTQGALARDAQGRTVGTFAPTATCWCLEGALKRVSDTMEDWENGLHMLAGEVSVPSAWNDTMGREQRDVLQLLDNLIARHA